jgi:hypothetical protein
LLLFNENFFISKLTTNKKLIMKKHQLNKAVVFAFAGMLMTLTMFAQQNPPASPPATATGKIGEATVTINYSSPSVKGRSVWDANGKLAPYGKAWRAGANQPTTFETDKAIKVEGKDLPAGKYQLYAIPGEKEWTWVFNSKIPGWGIKRTGEVDTDPASDVIRVTVKPVKSASMNERLVYEITSKGFSLKWENVEAPVSIK